MWLEEGSGSNLGEAAGVMEELNLDQDFLMRFSCMGTQDKDVLISELHGILESQLSREGCAFFLDMTNWYE